MNRLTAFVATTSIGVASSIHREFRSEMRNCCALGYITLLVVLTAFAILRASLNWNSAVGFVIFDGGELPTRFSSEYCGKYCSALSTWRRLLPLI